MLSGAVRLRDTSRREVVDDLFVDLTVEFLEVEQHETTLDDVHDDSTNRSFSESAVALSSVSLTSSTAFVGGTCLRCDAVVSVRWASPRCVMRTLGFAHEEVLDDREKREARASVSGFS